MCTPACPNARPAAEAASAMSLRAPRSEPSAIARRRPPPASLIACSLQTSETGLAPWYGGRPSGVAARGRAS